MKVTESSGKVLEREFPLPPDPNFKPLVPLGDANDPRAAARLIAEKHVRENLLLYVAKLEELGEGIWFEKSYTTKEGKEVRRIYRVAPSFDALKYLTDRAVGSPTKTEEIKHTSEVKVLQVNLDVSEPQFSANPDSTRSLSRRNKRDRAS